jgi:hypothetical protein
MGRPKSKDPATPITITLPKSLLRTSRAVASTKNLSFSAWVAELLREYFQQVEKALR